LHFMKRSRLQKECKFMSEKFYEIDPMVQIPQSNLGVNLHTLFCKLNHCNALGK
jgi:hypothetical protein